MPSGFAGIDNITLTDLIQENSSTSSFGVPDILDFARTTSTAVPYMLSRQLKDEFTCFIACSDLGISVKAPLPPDFDWDTQANYDTPMRELLDDGIGAAGAIGSVAKATARANGISFVTQALTAKFWSGSATGAITLPLILQAETNEVYDVMDPFIQLLSLSLPRLNTGKRGGVLQAPGPSFDLAKAYNAMKEGLSTLTSSSSSVAGVPSSSTGVGNVVGSVAGQLVSGFTGLMDAGKDNGVQGVWDEVSRKTTGAMETVDSLARQSIRNRISLQIGKYIFLESVVITNVQHKHLMQPVGYNHGVSSGNTQRIEVTVTFEPFMEMTQQDLPNIFLDPRVAELARRIVDRNAGNQSDRALDGLLLF